MSARPRDDDSRTDGWEDDVPLDEALMIRGRHLAESRRATDAIARLLRAWLALPRRKRIDARLAPPTVYLARPRDPDLARGRFLPKENAILALRGDDDGVVEATLVHEAAHWAEYARSCGGRACAHGMPRRRVVRECASYDGGHEATFYRTLEELHELAGTEVSAAIAVENAPAAAGGGFRGPIDWRAVGGGAGGWAELRKLRRGSGGKRMRAIVRATGAR